MRPTAAQVYLHHNALVCLMKEVSNKSPGWEITAFSRFGVKMILIPAGSFGVNGAKMDCPGCVSSSHP